MRQPDRSNIVPASFSVIFFPLSFVGHCGTPWDKLSHTKKLVFMRVHRVFFVVWDCGTHFSFPIEECVYFYSKAVCIHAHIYRVYIWPHMSHSPTIQCSCGFAGICLSHNRPTLSHSYISIMSGSSSRSSSSHPVPMRITTHSVSNPLIRFPRVLFRPRTCIRFDCFR